MIILLDTSEDYEKAKKEISGDIEIGQLITSLSRLADRGLTYGIDNGAFSKFNPKYFLHILERQRPAKDRCLFVAVPDLYGEGRRTLELFDHWYPKLCTWPLALVAQDGMEDFNLPWNFIAAIFIGGSDKWKNSKEAKAIAVTAKMMGKWVHVGRVNTPNRYDKWAEIADSIDGTGISKFTHMRKKLIEKSIFERPRAD